MNETISHKTDISTDINSQNPHNFLLKIARNDSVLHVHYITSIILSVLAF